MASWYTLTLNDNGGSGSSPTVVYYHDGVTVGYYYKKDTGRSNLITYLTTLPTRTYYKYLGHWTAKTGGSRSITPAGYLGSPYPVYTGSQTLYAHWQRLSYLLTLNKGDGSGGTSSIYGKATDGGWYSTWKCETEVSSITPPTRSGFVFMGYYSAAQGMGTAQKYINADGTFTDSFRLLVLTANTTLYAWWKIRRTITANANGGAGGTATFYYLSNDGAFFSDPACTNQITAITPPTKGSYLFLGFYDTDGTTGTKVVEQDGTISENWTPTDNATIYAQWRLVVDITLDRQGGESGDALIVYDSADSTFHLPNNSEPLEAVETPDLECYRFLGYFSAQSGGTKYIDTDGTLTPAFLSLAISSAFTIWAQWELVSYKATLDPGDGEATVLSFYCDGTDAEFFDNDKLSGSPLSLLTMPTRTGYACTGYWTAPTGGTKAVDADGTILCGVFAEPVAYYAQWQVRTFTIIFDYNGGGGSVATKTVTWGEPIGNLPTPTPPTNRPNAEFGGWKLDGATVTASTIWTGDADAALKAEWITAFAYVEDFFGLASNALIPIASTSGDTRHRVTAAHGGKYESGVNQIGGIWRNPSVTYVVKANTTVSVQLGKGFAAQKSGSTMTVSGFMITTVEINTEVGKFPTVTVSAVANEGANAVNNFTENKNKFNVSVPVVARSKAQNLLGAISGGGHLQRCALVATCDPVVCEENLMPCASDIVNGRYELAAETLAAENNAAPTMASASGSNGGFALIDDPKQTSESDFVRYTIQARREMV